MTSKGTWIANKSIFEKNAYKVLDKSGRFELCVKNISNDNSKNPKFNNCQKNIYKQKGWHIIYSDQCPWHNKSVFDLQEEAKNNNIKLNITKITTSDQAQNSPSAYGTFGIFFNGKIIEDHYISKTRFKNILKKYLNQS